MGGIDAGNFGLAIAFLAPGGVALWGISGHVNTIRAWFGSGFEVTAAGFLFVVLASFGIGLFLSGVRQQVLDDLLFKRLFGLERPPADNSRLADPNVLAALKFASDNLYRYHQFYGNMAVAVVVAYVGWLLSDSTWTSWRTLGAFAVVAIVVTLTLSAKYSVERYYDALGDLLTKKEPE